jgi:HlyD family secretion protein
LSRLREDLDKLLVRHEQIELVAPAAAIVKDIGTRTVGAVVAAGTVLITLVPTAEPLEAEVLLRNEDAAFVRPGQRVEVKIAAYPFQKYGLLDASVLRVGPDSTEPARSAEERGVASAYRARVALARQSLEHDGDRLPLASGMAVVAEIHLGRRPVADYLLGPVQKAWHESARER